MAPMDINDWWLAAAAAAATGFAAPNAGAATEVGTQVGVVTSVRAGVVSATNERVVYIGNSVAFGERFKTDSTGIIHILFMDQSSMTLGPNSELVINEFAYHPSEQRGNLAVNLIKGSLRVVGGFISKLTGPKGANSALVRTATATIGIRGGISVVDAQADQTQGTFLFGEHMDVLPPDGPAGNSGGGAGGGGAGGPGGGAGAGPNGPTGAGGSRVTRPGFSVIARTTSSGGGGIGNPFRLPPSEMAGLTSRFENRQSNGTTPGGNLISTNDRPNGTNTPGSSLAPDRVQKTSNEVQHQTPGKSLRDIMGNNSAQVQS